MPTQRGFAETWGDTAAALCREEGWRCRPGCFSGIWDEGRITASPKGRKLQRFVESSL